MAAGGGVGVFCFLRPLYFPMREDGLACIEGAVGRSSREGDLAAMAPAVVLPEPVVVNCFFDLRCTAGEEPPPACFFFHFVVRDLDDAKLHRMETVRLVGVRPTPSNLPCPSGSVTKMPWYNNLKPPHQLKRHVKDAFKHFDFHDLDLPEKMLTLDPSKRISANEALDSEYFWADPLPCDPKSLPTYEASHEYQTKKRRQQQRQADAAAAKWQKTIHIYM